MTTSTLDRFTGWLTVESQRGLVKYVSIPASTFHNNRAPAGGYEQFAKKMTDHMASRQGIKYEIIYFPLAGEYVAVRLPSSTVTRPRPR